MPRGRELTNEECRIIDELVDRNTKKKDIADRLNRSPSCITKYLKRKDENTPKKRCGRPPKISPRDRSRLVRQALLGKRSASQLVYDQSLPLTKRRVQQILSSHPNLNYEKRAHAPVLTTAHKEKRLEFARKYFNKDDVWAKTIFSDEKKFNLDGPDCLQYYWHDLRTEKQTYKTRQSGGGSVMIWGAFSLHGKSELAFIEGTQDSVKYCETLESYLLPFANLHYGDDYIFQQDNASIHSSQYTKEVLNEHKITVMDWPAKSPDLNPIENMWGKLVREVYPNGKQYDNRDKLKEEILKQWQLITPQYVEILVRSMNNRCFEVISKKGGKTKY
jgi:transposase